MCNPVRYRNWLAGEHVRYAGGLRCAGVCCKMLFSSGFNAGQDLLSTAVPAPSFRPPAPAPCAPGASRVLHAFTPRLGSDMGPSCTGQGTGSLLQPAVCQEHTVQPILVSSADPGHPGLAVAIASVCHVPNGPDLDQTLFVVFPYLKAT